MRCRIASLSVDLRSADLRSADSRRGDSHCGVWGRLPKPGLGARPLQILPQPIQGRLCDLKGIGELIVD